MKVEEKERTGFLFPLPLSLSFHLSPTFFWFLRFPLLHKWGRLPLNYVSRTVLHVSKGRRKGKDWFPISLPPITFTSFVSNIFLVFRGSCSSTNGVPYFKITSVGPYCTSGKGEGKERTGFLILPPPIISMSFVFNIFLVFEVPLLFV